MNNNKNKHFWLFDQLVVKTLQYNEHFVNILVFSGECLQVNYGYETKTEIKDNFLKMNFY